MPTLFLITFAIFVLRPQDFVPGMIGLPIVQVLLLIGIAQLVASKDKKITYFPLLIAVAFVFVAAFGIGINGYWGGVGEVVGRMMPDLVLFALAACSTRTRKDFDRFAWVMILSCAVLVFHGYQQKTTGIGFTGMPLVEETRIQYVGVFSDPNDLGLLFVMGMVSSGYLLISSGTKIAKLLAILSIGWLAYGVLLTESRGTMLACIAVLACIGVKKYGVTRSIVSAAIGLPILWGGTRLATVSNQEESAEGRIDAWYEGFNMLRDNPVFGVGFGNFTDHNYLTAHNSLVLVMAETGVLGYTLWFAFMAYGFRAAFRSAELKNPLSTEQLLMSRAILLTYVGICVAIFFLSRSYNPLLFILCGLAIARSAQSAAGKEPQFVPSGQQLKPIVYSAWASIPIMFIVTKLLLTL